MKKIIKDDKKCQCQDLQQQIVDLQKKCEEMEEGWKRSSADFANFKRRSEEEKKIIFDVAKTEAVLGFFPVYDSISRALEAMNDNKDGLEKIMRSFEVVLNSYGITKLDLDMTKFDPRVAEAIGYIDNTDQKKSGQIAVIVEEAFVLGDKLIRPAKVMIFK